MNDKNGNKIKGIKKLQAEEGNISYANFPPTYLRCVAPLKSMCDPTSGNEDPFMACGKSTISEGICASTRLEGKYRIFSHLRVTEFQR